MPPYPMLQVRYWNTDDGRCLFGFDAGAFVTGLQVVMDRFVVCSVEVRQVSHTLFLPHTAVLSPAQ